jgi:hypothetical protein
MSKKTKAILILTDMVELEERLGVFGTKTEAYIYLLDAFNVLIKS